MAKYRIISPIYFDGVLFPAGVVIDAAVIGLSGEALVERSWAVEHAGDEPAIESIDVLRDAMPPELSPELSPEPIPEPVPESEPVVDMSESSDLDEPKPRKRKS
jgi:hypothetical protein